MTVKAMEAICIGAGLERKTAALRKRLVSWFEIHGNGSSSEAIQQQSFIELTAIVGAAYDQGARDVRLP